MPRLKYKKKGKRVNLWLPDHQMKTAVQIDNLSAFFQIALDNAADIMAWAILRGIEPQKYNTSHKVEDVIEKFNEDHPLDPLTAKRVNKCPKISPKTPELW